MANGRSCIVLVHLLRPSGPETFELANIKIRFRLAPTFSPTRPFPVQTLTAGNMTVMPLNPLQAIAPEKKAATHTAFAEAEKQSIFYSAPWFENYFETIQDSDSSYLFLSASTDRGCAALPMKYFVSTEWPYSRSIYGAQNYYSCLFGPAVAGEHTDELYDKLLQPVCAQRLDVFDVHPLDPLHPSFKALQKALRRKGWIIDKYLCFGNWQLDVNGRSFADYFQTLPSTLKNTIKRKTQALTKKGNARLEIITEEADTERLISDYTQIYNSSWKKPEPYTEFMPGLIRTCAKHGWLRAGIAYIDDTPAAAQIWIVHNSQALIYKLAYDEQFGKLSIGSILTTKLMEHVIDVDKVSLVDYLTGDEPYKRDWMSRRNERWGIIAYNPRTLSGLLAAARHFGGKWLKKLRKPADNKTQDDQE